jgi:cell division protein FtsW
MTDMVFGTTARREGEPVLPHWWRTVDRWSIGAVVGLILCGLLLGLAASPPLAERNNLDPFHFVTRQAQFGVLSVIVMLVLSMMPPRLVRRLAVIGFGAALVALVLLPFLGTDHGKGAVRWFSILGLSVQPSEFLKPAFAVFAAWLMSASFDVGGPPGRMMSLGVAALLALLLALQPDFGQAMLIVATWGLMYFVAGAPVALLVGLAGAVAGCGLLAYEMSEHFARRIDAYLSGEIDPTTQIGYAASAIQEGGIFGVGPGEGQVKWSLPDAHTDYIMAVAAEEYGLLLCLLIVALYLVIVLRSLARLVRERDHFIRLAGTGLAASLALQALINIGVTARLLPAKGMTLPFVSYGGSSLIAAGILVGALLAFTRRRPQDEMSEIIGRGR